jgi:serine/threonine protein kinase/tetratricopeptide (TPR) repeat protein
VKKGQKIGEELVMVRQIGKGGMGEVWLAEDVPLGRNVAIKFFTAAFGKEDEQGARFLREARAVARINSPHVVAVHGFSVSEGESPPYLIMEWINGESLQERINHERRISPQSTVHVALQIALALDAAHQSEVIHRDLKPENVLLCTMAGDPWYVKVVDFGLARSYEENEDGNNSLGGVTTATVVLGTPRYMSPEQALGKKLDARSDLYSLGLLLYQMLSGKHAIVASTPQEYMVAHQVQRPIPIREIEGLENLNPELANLIMSLLDKRPSARPANAGVVASFLRSIEAALDTESGPQMLAALEQVSEDSENPTVMIQSEPYFSAQDTIMSETQDTMEGLPGFDPGRSRLNRPGLIHKKLLGRKREMEELFATFDDVRKGGTPLALLVQGSSGSGISRLLIQFLAEIHQRYTNTRIFRLYPWSGFVDMPGRPMVDLVLAAAGLDARQSTKDYQSALFQSLSILDKKGLLGTLDHRSAIMGRASVALETLLGAPGDSTNKNRESAKEDILEYSARFLSGVFGEDTVIVCIDQANYLRPGAVQLLNAWLERLHPGRWLFLLGQSANVASRVDFNKYERLTNKTITLPPLAAEDMRVLADHYAGQLNLPAGHFDADVEACGGLPGLLHGRAMEDLLDNSLNDYLSKANEYESLVLKTLYASGGSAPLALMKAMLGASVEDALDLWARHGIVVKSNQSEFGTAPGFVLNGSRFKGHVPPLDSKVQRVALHTAGSDWVHGCAEDGNLLLAPRIIEHAFGRGHLSQTLLWTERAAALAQRTGAYGDAAEATSRLIHALEVRATKGPLSSDQCSSFTHASILLAKLHYRVHRNEKAISVIKRACKVLSSRNAPEYRLGHARLLATEAEMLEDASLKRDLLKQAADLLPDSSGISTEDVVFVVEMLCQLGIWDINLGHAQNAERALSQALNIARDKGSLIQRLTVTRALVALAVYQGEHDEAERRLEALVEESNASGNKLERLSVQVELGYLKARLGSIAKGLDMLRAAIAELKLENSPKMLVEARLREAQILVFRPDPWAARRALEEMVLNPDAQPAEEARRLEYLARVLLDLGESKGAYQAAQTAESLAKSIHDTKTQLRAQLCILKVRASRGEHAVKISRDLKNLVKKQRLMCDHEGTAASYVFTAREAVAGRIKGMDAATASDLFDKAEDFYRKAGLLPEARRIGEIRRHLAV